jgi:hypothetical protein
MDPAIETAFEEASARWRLLRFLRRSARLAIVVASLVLLFGLGMTLGWFTSSTWMTVCFGLLTAGAIVAWAMIGLVTSFTEQNRKWLAAALERSHKPLMDRLNTLVFLDENRDPRSDAYVGPIERQAHDVLAGQPTPSPFSDDRVWPHFVVLACVVAATIVFYAIFQPWQRVLAASNPSGPSTPNEEPYLEIPPPGEPPEAAPEEALPWGRIRISEPGCDLRATTLDVIPLRIEAAANQPLATIEWLTGVNGEPANRHPLPPPDDPRYVVCDVELAIEDHNTLEWDVLSYIARATTVRGRSCQSDVYFVDVIPFREELEKLPGGANGYALALLERLTRVLAQQQEVIRQTLRQEQWADQPAEDRTERNRILAREEAHLRSTALHLAAEAVSRLEPSAIDGLDERFERAESALDAAERSLLDDDPEKTREHEWAALAELIATRKHLYRLVRDNPDAFEQPADRSVERLVKREDPQNEQLDERARLKQALDRQVEQYRRIEERPETFSPDELRETTQQTEDLLERLQKLTDQERAGRELPSELSEKLTDENRQRLTQECERLRESRESDERRQSAGNLKEGLRKLSQALETDGARQRLADALSQADRRRELMQLRRRREESARQAVRKTLLAERNLEQRADPKKPREFVKHAVEQRVLNREFDKSLKQNSEEFRRCQGQCSSAQSAMQQAADSLGSQSSDARQDIGKAADQLQKLDDALGAQQQRTRMAEAYDLRDMLDRQIQQLGQCQKHGAGGEQRRQLAGQAKNTTGMLKQAAEEEPTSKSFGQPLRDALSDQRKQELDRRADQLSEASDLEEQKQASGELRERLEAVRDAFDASLPRMLARQRQGARPGEDGRGQIAQGMRRLESAARRQAGGRRLSPHQRSRLAGEALANFQEGLPAVYGDNQQSRQAMRELEQELMDPGVPLDVEIVQRLLDEISQMRRGEETDNDREADAGPTVHVDPSRLPPAYRKSIEAYFEKLSEQ